MVECGRNTMRIIVITGPSGAGKTYALHSFEDAGYYTVDNLPPRLLPALAAYCRTENHERCAVVIDVRAGAAFAELPEVVTELRAKEHGFKIEILFLDASDTALVQRFKETRRPHPMLRGPIDGVQGIQQDSIVEAIRTERALLQTARAFADSILDTSTMTANQLRDTMHTNYAPQSRPGLLVTVTSFGFKHGLPIDADLVFDVRFLSNPYYIPELRGHDGRDIEVADYVHADPLTEPFARRMTDLVEFALPEYRREGKAYLNIAIGCTGGQHRSVVLAEDLAARLQGEGYHTALRHRDVIERGSSGGRFLTSAAPTSETTNANSLSEERKTPGSGADRKPVLEKSSGQETEPVLSVVPSDINKIEAAQ